MSPDELRRRAQPTNQLMFEQMDQITADRHQTGIDGDAPWIDERSKNVTGHNAQESYVV